MPLPVTLDLECKKSLRQLNGTKSETLKNTCYNKTLTLLEDHYFQERLEQFQTLFTVYQLNKMSTGTFTFIPAGKDLIYDITRFSWTNDWRSILD